MSVTAADSREDRHMRMSEALRAYGESYGQLGRAFAASADLHSTDATALLEILRAEEQGSPLSPARLGDRVGLTSGATSSLLNRLEDAGHILRSREHADRRIVTLRSTPDIHKVADTFFDPLEERITTTLDTYAPEVLDQMIGLLEQLHTAIEEYRSDSDPE